jgi:hypothetical protein
MFTCPACGSQIVIFVVDSQDFDGIGAARNQLHFILGKVIAWLLEWSQVTCQFVFPPVVHVLSLIWCCCFMSIIQLLLQWCFPLARLTRKMCCYWCLPTSTIQPTTASMS